MASFFLVVLKSGKEFSLSLRQYCLADGYVPYRYSAWAIHRSPIVFGPDANVFRPERWLDVPERQLQKMERNSELIFGFGRFKCLGKNVAFMELNKVIVEVR